MTSVHWNLHRLVWSVKVGREPVRHTTAVRLLNVTFRVREKARLQVVAQRCRQVHAFAVGTEGPVPSRRPRGAVAVSYNPYRGGSFYRKDTGQPVAGAREVVFLPDGAYAVGCF